MDAIEAGKRCAAIVWGKVIVLFIAAGAYSVFVNRTDMDALAGSLAGLACLLAILCVGGFSYGYLKSAHQAASTDTLIQLKAASEQQSEAPNSGQSTDSDNIVAALIVGLLFILFKSEFHITAMPATAMKILNDIFVGLASLFGFI